MMSRLIFKVVLFITLIMTTTSLAARAIGNSQPPNPALRGFTDGCEGKPQSQLCWYGIIVGETPIEDVVHKLEQEGYSTTRIEDTSSANLKQFWRAVSPDSSLCQVNIVSTFPMWTDATQTKMIRYVETLLLQDCPHIKLGDLFPIFKTSQIVYDGCRAKGISFGSLSLNDWRLNLDQKGSPSPFLPQDSIDNISLKLWGDRYSKIENMEYGFAFPWKLNRILWNKYCRNG